jgi:IS5 family transposase
VLTDANGTPVMFCVTGANRHDSVVFEEMIDALPAIKGKPGRPRRWPDKLHADKAYDCRRCRQHLRRLGIRVRFERSTSTHVALLSLACSIICLRTLRRLCQPLLVSCTDSPRHDMPRTRSAACALTYTEVTRRSECPSRLCSTCGCICLIASLAKVWRSQWVEAFKKG